MRIATALSREISRNPGGLTYNLKVLSCWGKVTYNISKAALWTAAKLLFRIRFEGRQNIPRKGGVLVASNHVSHLDPPLVGTGIPRYMFNMAKKELFKIKPLLRFMKLVGTIMVDRGRGQQALEDAVDYLNRGACVVIFPEGTRSETGRLGRGRTGAIVIAVKTDCQIVPAVIVGSEKALTKGSKWIKCVPVTIRYGKPYQIDYQGDVDDIPRDFLRRECKRMMDKIEELLPEHMKPLPESKTKWYKSLETREKAATGSEAS
jgi:1-acyl-sn-glycerol-3-phosphate acyltransferase